jgi:urease accessory protein
MSLNSSLHIKAGFKNGRTYLKESYATHPYKVANVTEDKSADLLKLMLMSSSPGVLDNDKYEFEIDVEANAKLVLTTQGYQRLFAMKSGASQKVIIKVGDDGCFTYLPHPGVPHEGSDFSSDNTIHLAEKHKLLWSEITTCGRKLSGEEFKFRRYKNMTDIYIKDRLIVRENVLLEPSKRKIHSIGQLENYSHQSSLLYLCNNARIEQLVEECNELLLMEDGIIFGVSRLAVNGLVIRMLGYKGEQLYNLHNALSEIITNAEMRKLVATT